MSQLYRVSWVDWEDNQAWEMIGPDLTNDEWEALWEKLLPEAINLVGESDTVVFEDRLIEQMVELLIREGFKHTVPEHTKSFNFAGRPFPKELYSKVPKKWMPEVAEFLETKKEN